MPNPIVHFEIIGPDGDALQSFYSDLFGWSINKDNPMGYGLTETGDGSLGGGIASDPTPLCTIYIGVDDPAAHLEKIKAAGGEVETDVTVIPGMVTFARFKDPAGNIVGLVKADE